MQHFIWVFTDCQRTCLPVSIMKRVNIRPLDTTEGALTCMPVNWKPNFSTCGNLVISLAILAGPASGSYVFFPILISTTHGFLYLETRFSSFIYVTEIEWNLDNSNLLTLGMLNILYKTPPCKTLTWLDLILSLFFYCCGCPRYWGRQQVGRVSNTQSPSISVQWIDAAKAAHFHLSLNTLRPGFFRSPSSSGARDHPTCDGVYAWEEILNGGNKKTLTWGSISDFIWKNYKPFIRTKFIYSSICRSNFN